MRKIELNQNGCTCYEILIELKLKYKFILFVILSNVNLVYVICIPILGNDIHVYNIFSNFKRK